MNLKEVNELIRRLEDAGETLLVDFYKNRRRILIEKIQREIDRQIWELVK